MYVGSHRNAIMLQLPIGTLCTLWCSILDQSAHKLIRGIPTFYKRCQFAARDCNLQLEIVNM